MVKEEIVVPVANTYIKLVALFIVVWVLLVLTVYLTFWYTAATGVSENFTAQTVFLIWGIIIATAVDLFIVITRRFIDISTGKKSVDERLNTIEISLSKIEHNTKKKKQKK